MEFWFNRQRCRLKEPATLKELLLRHRYGLDWIVVSYNRRIVRPERWESIVIRENDDIEVLTLSFLGEGI